MDLTFFAIRTTETIMALASQIRLTLTVPMAIKRAGPIKAQLPRPVLLTHTLTIKAVAMPITVSFTNLDPAVDTSKIFLAFADSVHAVTSSKAVLRADLISAVLTYKPLNALTDTFITCSSATALVRAGGS